MLPPHKRLLSPGLSFVLCAVLMTTVAACFGSYSVATSLALPKDSTLSPLVFALLRDVIGTSSLLATAAFVEWRRRPNGNGRLSNARWSWCYRLGIAAEDRWRVLLVGLCGVWGAQGMSALAIANSTASFYTFLSNVQPVVTLALSAAIGLERCSPRAPSSYIKAAGVAVTVAGAALIVALAAGGGSGSIASGSRNLPLAMLATAIAIVLGGSYGVVQKPLLLRYPPVLVAGWGYASGTLLLLLCVVTGANEPADWDVSPAAAGVIVYTGIVCSFFTYGAMAVCNHLQGPGFVAAFLPFQALFTALGAALLQGRQMPVADAGAAAAMIAGVLLLVGVKWRQEVQAAETAATVAGSFDAAMTVVARCSSKTVQ